MCPSNDVDKNWPSSSQERASWHEISWKDEISSVKRLRSRIYLAAKAGDLKKVKDLQRLLISSKSNILVSIRRITMINQGKKTPGVDKLKYLNLQIELICFDNY